MRLATILLCALGVAVWAATCWATFLSGSDPATAGLDDAAGGAVTLLFALTTGPSIGLTVARRMPRLALWLAVLFPASFILLFLGAVLAFA
jgi:hypothetical protein